MLAKYDETTITLTPRYLAALEELGRAELEMMRLARPDQAEDWTWCTVIVGDLSSAQGLYIESGGEQDRPAGFPQGEVQVISEAEFPTHPEEEDAPTYPAT